MGYRPYSHSKLNTASCPFLFKKKYIEKAEGIERANLRFGEVVHLILADILKAKLNKHMWTLEFLLKKHAPPELFPRLQEIQDIAILFDKRFDVDGRYVVGVEEKLAIDEHGHDICWEQAYLRGILDLIEIDGEHATITDHKTQYNILSESEMDKNDQLSFYCYLVKHFYPQVKNFTVKIYFARYGIFKSSKRDIAELALFEERLKTQIHRVERIKEWVPIPGYNCSICEYMHMCPIASYDSAGKESVSKIFSQDQAVEAARLMCVRKEQIKQLEDALKQFCSAHGEVQVSDGYAFGYRKSTTTEWPVDKTLQVFQKHDYNFADHITFSKASLKKLIARTQRLDEDFAKDIEAVGKEITETRFGGYKK